MIIWMGLFTQISGCSISWLLFFWGVGGKSFVRKQSTEFECWKSQRNSPWPKLLLFYNIIQCVVCIQNSGSHIQANTNLCFVFCEVWSALSICLRFEMNRLYRAVHRMLQHEKLRQLECQRVHTLRLMLEKEQRFVEALRSELAKSNEPKILQELAGAERRVRTLQDQLVNLTMHAEHEVGYSYKFCLITPLKPNKYP